MAFKTYPQTYAGTRQRSFSYEYTEVLTQQQWPRLAWAKERQKAK